MRKLKPQEADLLQGKINLFEAKALADAELFHSHPEWFDRASKRDHESLLDTEEALLIDGRLSGKKLDRFLEEVKGKFADTEENKVLQQFFTSCHLYVEARALENPRPGQVQFMLDEHSGIMRECEEKIIEMAKHKRIPQESLRCAQAAHEIATIDVMQDQWRDTLRAREESGIIGRTGKFG